MIRLAAIAALASGCSLFLDGSADNSEVDAGAADGRGAGGALALWLPFDDMQDPEREASGSGLEVTIFGGASVISQSGRTGLALDGVDDHVQVMDSQALGLDDELTIAVWVFQPVDQRSDLVATKCNSEATGYRLNTQSAEEIRFEAGNGASEQALVTAVPELGRWYHVASVYDSAAGSMAVYIDGAPANGRAASSSIIPNSDRPLFIGRYPCLEQYYFSGLIDDVRIYRAALDQTAIQALVD